MDHAPDLTPALPGSQAPTRDAALDRVARLALALTALDAALVWQAGAEHAPCARWGAAGVIDAWDDASAVIRAAQAVEPGAVNQHELDIGGRRLRLWLATPAQTADADADCRLAVLGGADAPPALAPERLLQRLLEGLRNESEAISTPAISLQRHERRAAAPLEARLRSAMRAMRMGSWVYRVQERQLTLSDDAAAILGDAAAPMRGIEQLLQAFTPDTAARLGRAFKACIRDGQPIDAEAQFGPSEAGRGWVHFIGEVFLGEQGGLLEVHGAVQDISARKQAQAETVRLAMRLTTTLASITEAFVTLDRQGQFMYVNRASEQLLGRRAGELLGQAIDHGLSGRSQGRLRAELEGALQRNQHAEFEDFYPSLDKWLEIRAHPYAEGLAVYFRDVTARKQADEKIYRLAFFDPLTELPNRPLLIETLEAALDEVERSGQEGALMFIDLDNFKVLNDTMGHSLGDLLLRRVAERLRRSVRQSDTVARIGGDEFVIVLQALGDDPETAAGKAQAVASKVLARLHEPFDLGGYQHHCTASIGVASFNAGHAGVSELLKQADLAMYHAKSLGRDTVAFFDPALQASLSASAALGADLRSALQSGEQLGVHYQPLFDQTRRIVGMEALARWQHPVRGAIEPAEFIPVAEDTGLILPLGLWVLEQACGQLAAWAASAETAALSISVNVSARQFRHPEFVDRVIAALARHQVAPRRLNLELTESLLADRMEITLAKMDSIKRLGVTLTLDDFGTGYSSLAYLKRLPLDQLKIDKGFVADVLDDPSDAAIARAIIALAHSQGLAVIAEGVETEAQLRFLTAGGCDLFQGFLLARPMALPELEAFMRTQTLAASG